MSKKKSIVDILMHAALFCSVSGLGVWFSGTPAHAAPSAKEVMQKSEDARKLQDVTSKSTLTTGGGGSPERVKKFTWWRKLTPDGVHFNTLTRFHEPAEIRGQGILFIENAGGENDVQMYLPTFKKVRRVESQAQSGSFMGSEFSYSDIATPHVDDYNHTSRADEACPGGEAKTSCHVVEATPVNDGVKERTGYSKTVTWVRSDNFMPVQAEYYDAEGKLWKKMQAGEHKEVDTAKHKWMALRVRMENLKNGKFTLLQFAEVKGNTGIADATFTVQNLKKQ